MNARERERAALAEIWKKASAEGELTATLSDKNIAMRLRFQLNNLATAVRKLGAFGDDPELFEAVENCVVRGTGCVVSITHRNSRGLEEAMTHFGITLEGVESTEDRTLRESLGKLGGLGNAKKG